MSSNALPLSIRPASAAQLSEIQDLARRTINACYRGFLGDEAVDWYVGSGASDEHIEAQLAQENLYCLTQNEQIVGISILDGSTVDLIMIDPGHHRQGLGRLLLSHAEETLFALHPRLQLETFPGNASAVSFYESCGWTLEKRLEEDGLLKLVYQKTH
ncbi:GNAT family N-acetyltransferase [Glutamicibacter sp.]|uniref:GNAT family N-acetyltransferase n=1 Tax=Glutamicibacter sp. TaxID=1931995 RepID=UPI0028BD516A|nr:GNAT family N-acetyltransferase [Glutamicibacter sp.]